jgi:hypothetical protein
MSDPRIPARDAGLRRLSHLTGWIGGAAIAGAGVIAIVLAGAQHHATAITSDPSVIAPVGGSQVGEDPGQSQQGGLQAPLTPPLPAAGGGSGPVSGGS